MRYSSYGGFRLSPVLAIIIVCLLVYIATIVANIIWTDDPEVGASIFALCPEAARIFAQYGYYPEPMHFLLGLTPMCLFHMPWTIVTNLFVHGGIWHLAANMLTLFFFGRFLSGLIGTRSFLVIYFFGGILGNVFFMVFSFLGQELGIMLLGSPLATVVGASGAIFALGGTLAVLTPRLRVFMIPIPVPMPLWVAVIGGFIIMSFFPNVAWQGHLGGLIFGLIAGFVLRRRVRVFLR